MVIELVGLPGTGKTTICKAIRVSAGGKGIVPLHALRPTPAFFNALWRLSALSVTARPFRMKRVKRAFNAAMLLRHYQPSSRNIVLDQGIVQKLWSVLADAENYSEVRLNACIKALTAFAPDHLIWIDTPLDVALVRLAARTGGNSRYDGLPREEAKALLSKREALLNSLAQRLAKTSGRDLKILDGRVSAEANAARLDALLL